MHAARSVVFANLSHDCTAEQLRDFAGEAASFAERQDAPVGRRTLRMMSGLARQWRDELQAGTPLPDEPEKMYDK